jgi:hypothetical protein
MTDAHVHTGKVIQLVLIGMLWLPPREIERDIRQVQQDRNRVDQDDRSYAFCDRWSLEKMGGDYLVVVSAFEYKVDSVDWKQCFT